MAIEDVPGGMKPYARPFNLVPPPRDLQFRTATLKAERSKRKADRRLASALDEGEAVSTPLIWPSLPAFGLLPRFATCGLACRRGRRKSFTVSWSASCPAKPRLRSGTRPSPPCARLAAPPIVLRDVRPRKWRQAFPDLNGW